MEGEMMEQEKKRTYIHADTVRPLKPYIDPDAIVEMVVRLFARVPDLAQKLIEVSERDKAANKIPSFFNYVFVGASIPADGANYNIVGYRLRDVDEIFPVGGALNGNTIDTHESISSE